MSETEPQVRINFVVPESERDAFDRWCRYGGKPKMTMSARLRSLIKADAAGKLHLPRGEEEPEKKKPRK